MSRIGVYFGAPTYGTSQIRIWEPVRHTYWGTSSIASSSLLCRGISNYQYCVPRFLVEVQYEVPLDLKTM